MTTTASAHERTTGARQSLHHAVLGGLAGGVVFGVMMHSLGMMRMVALLVGSESLTVGWSMHLAISAVFGAVYGALVAPRCTGWGSGLASGAVYGALLWVAGPLLLMPARLDMPLFTVDSMAVRSLVGHIVFGVVLGAVVVALSGRQRR